MEHVDRVPGDAWIVPLESLITGEGIPESAAGQYVGAAVLTAGFFPLKNGKVDPGDLLAYLSNQKVFAIIGTSWERIHYEVDKLTGGTACSIEKDGFDGSRCIQIRPDFYADD